jgi:O-antigen chain-terminating methyltransferase
VSVLSGLDRTPLRILDVGCAQGYFALGIADRLRAHANVTGVDGLAANLDVCEALREHLGLPVTFEHREFDTSFVESLTHDSYDVVLLLSVVHHLAHREGMDAAIAAIRALARKVPIVFLELAVQEEGLEWLRSLTYAPSAFLEVFAFARELGRYSTHVSSVPRPMYFASNQYALVDGRAYPFGEMRTYPHTLDPDAHSASRRYFLGGGLLIKRASLAGDPGAHNRNEFRNERQLLLNEAVAPRWFPKILAYEETNEEIFLVRQRTEGSLLSDALGSGMQQLPARTVIEALLGQLADLEDRGLYHHDIRPWNVVVDTCAGSATLIDFGSIDKRCDPLVFDAFFALLHAVATGKLVRCAPAILRSHRVGEGFPEEWRWFVDRANELCPDALTFRNLLSLLRDGPSAPMENAPSGSIFPALFSRLEQRFNAVVDHFGEQLSLYRDALSRSATGVDGSVREALAHEARARASYESLRSLVDALQANLAEAGRYATSLEEAARQKDAYARELMAALERARSTETEEQDSMAVAVKEGLQAEIFKLRQLVEQSITYNVSLTKTLAAKDAYMTGLARECESLEQSLAQARTSYASRAAELEQARALLLAVPQAYLRSAQSLAAEWGDYLAARANNRSLEAQLVAETETRTELVDRLATIEVRATSAEQRLSKLQQHVAALTAALSEARTQGAAVAANLEQASAELEERRVRDAALRRHWIVRWLSRRIDRSGSGG